MIDVVLTLVFSIVMLFFMAYPAMKIVDLIETKIALPSNWRNPLLISTTVLLSLAVGLFLRFA